MSDTTFIDGETRIVSAWLNDINKLTYDILSLTGGSTTLTATGAFAVQGAFDAQGSFTSLGIDDNASSTAITIDSSENVAFTGNVGIGEEVPLAKLHVKTADSGIASLQAAADDFLVEGNGNSGLTIASGITNVGSLIFGRSTLVGAGRIQYYHGTNEMRFWTNDTQRVVIDSSGDTIFGGNVSLADNKSLYLGTDNDLVLKHSGAIGSIINDTGSLYIVQAVDGGSLFLDTHDSVGTNKTNIRIGGATPYVRLYYDGLEVFSTVSGGFQAGIFSNVGATAGAKLTTSGVIGISKTITGASSHIVFYNPNGAVGSITTTGSTTAYNTTSDKRLKTSHGLLTNAADIVDSISIHEYHFNADESVTLHGIMAQDCYEIYPNAVNKPENEDDNWGVDYSKLVPIMLANIQQLNKQVEVLQNVN